MILKDSLKLTDKIIEHRSRVRRVYSSEEGLQELFNWILDSGFLDEIGPDRLSTRNLMVKKLQEMGLLDEEVVRECLRNWFASRPEVKETERMMEQKELAKRQYEKDVFSINENS